MTESVKTLPMYDPVIRKFPFEANEDLVSTGVCYLRVSHNGREMTIERVGRYRIHRKSITCLQCGMTSHNPNDVERRYCGACREFLAGVHPPRGSR